MLVSSSLGLGWVRVGVAIFFLQCILFLFVVVRVRVVVVGVIFRDGSFDESRSSLLFAESKRIWI